METLAIDPGEVHCGMAWHSEGKVRKVLEMGPDDCVDYVDAWIHEAEPGDTLVVEQFRLYPWMAAQQTWSELKTVAVIGQLQLCWRWYGQERGVVYVEQPASIKKPTSRVLQARGVKSLARLEKKGGHCRDAELHAYYYNRKED